MSPDLHTLTGAYAAHALPLDEEREFEEHLRACDACTQEVRELEATTARLAGGVAVLPPPALKAAVMAHILTVRQLPPVGGPRHGSAEVVPLHRSWYRSPLGVAAAALLVLTLGASGFAARERNQLRDERSASAAASAIVADPARQVRAAKLGSGSATVISAGGRAVVFTTGLPALASGRVYQLWLIDGKTITSEGLLPKTGAARRVLDALPGRASVAISVEPDGGSDQPSTEPVAVVKTA